MADDFVDYIIVELFIFKENWKHIYIDGLAHWYKNILISMGWHNPFNDMWGYVSKR